MNIVMSVDIGVTTGYAIVRQDMLVERCGNLEFSSSQVALDQLLYSVAMRYHPSVLLLEYPVLDKNNPLYKKLSDICFIVDEFVMNFKESQTWGARVKEIQPGTWKIPPVMRFDLSNLNGEYQDHKLTQHQKDAILMCYYYTNWSTWQ